MLEQTRRCFYSHPSYHKDNLLHFLLFFHWNCGNTSFPLKKKEISAVCRSSSGLHWFCCGQNSRTGLVSALWWGYRRGKIQQLCNVLFNFTYFALNILAKPCCLYFIKGKQICDSSQMKQQQQACAKIKIKKQFRHTRSHMIDIIKGINKWQYHHAITRNKTVKQILSL